jgi:hypothetical protein
MTSKVLAVAAATMALMSAAPMMSPTAASYHQDIRVSSPAQPQPVRVAPVQQSARNEVERVAEDTAVPALPYNFARKSQHRRPGDRAHKRMKHRRASGRR